MSVTKLTSTNSREFLAANKDSYVVLIFNAEFTEQQDIVDKSIQAINESDLKDRIVLGTVDVEENNDLATEYSVLTVPMVTCILKGQTVKKVDTLDPIKLVKTLKEELNRHSLLSLETGDKNDPKEKFNEYLKRLTNRAPVMIFMKGDPKAPRCGFSKQLVELLSKHASIKYDTFDILQDDEVRQGLKEYSDWPTYPQVYAKGEFIGGLDILKELEETGELESTLNG